MYSASIKLLAFLEVDTLQWNPSNCDASGTINKLSV